jgi:hypothetical protein
MNWPRRSAAERLAVAHHHAELLYHGSCGNHTESYDDHIAGHLPCFIEDQNESTRELIEAVELGLAWQEAKAALPDGGSLDLKWFDAPGNANAALAVASRSGSWVGSLGQARGDTEAAALRALSAKLLEAG